MSKHLMSLGLCALAAACAPAFAQSAPAPAVLSSELTQLRYQLIDLNPNDGILPEITFDASSFQASLGYRAPGAEERFDSTSSGVAERDWVGAKLRFAVAEDALSASIAVGETTPLGTTLHAGGTLHRSFSLTPYTGVIWTAAVGLAGDQAYAFGQQSATLAGQLIDDVADTFDERQTFSAGASVGLPWNGSETDSLSGYLYSDGRARKGFVDFAVNNWIYVTSPVPEPATYGMFLAGIALLGMRLRRQRRA